MATARKMAIFAAVRSALGVGPRNRPSSRQRWEAALSDASLERLMRPNAGDESGWQLIRCPKCQTWFYSVDEKEHGCG